MADSTLERHATAAGSDVAETWTFLFTDVEGSTRLWELVPDAMASALERHDAILTSSIAASGGEVVKTTGDGMMAVFESAGSAAAASAAAQRALQHEPWPEDAPIRVRMGLHSGPAETRGGDYFGPTINRTARIMAAGHGGQVLLSGATAAMLEAARAGSMTLRDLGEHRLKDLERPERIFQLVEEGLATEFPPPLTLDYRPNNLPTQTSAFVGREAELAAIRERIADPGIRLLTLTGPGGTGKTRLALRAAADEIDRFRDGVFFVDVTSATNTDAVIALIATAIGVRDSAGSSPVDALKRHLRNREVLLVLDNLEQVTVAAPTLVELLGDCGGVKLLVTSREALQVRAEHLFAVPPMSLPDEAASVSAAGLGGFEAIQLFVERARAVRPDFRLTDDNAAAVVEICRRLDGLPLAIELATARIGLFTPEALRDRLGSRLNLLRSGPRDLPVRQQTLRATIEWSYQLLDPPEQRLFELLSVFGPSDVGAIEAVASRVASAAGVELDVIDGLTSLLNKNLVRQTDASGPAGARVHMLETIREFAAERLDTQPVVAAAAREVHAAHFAALAAQLWAQSSGADPEGGLAALAAELENLRLAWRQAVAVRDEARLAQLVDGLWHLYQSRGWYHATIGLTEDQLAVLAEQERTPERRQQELTLRLSQARALTMLRGYTGEVEDAYQRVIDSMEGDAELVQAFPALRALISYYGFRGEYEKGLVLAEQVLALADTHDDASMRVEGLLFIGTYRAFGGHLEEGLRQLDEAIELFERRAFQPRRLRLGNDPRVTCLTTSGFFLWLLGKPDQALARAGRAVQLARDLDHPYSMAYALYHSGFLHQWRREHDLVRERAEAVLELVEANDLPVWRALGYCLLGAATTALGDPTAGLAQIEKGIDLYQGLRTPPVFWPLLQSMEAAAHLQAGNAVEGRRILAEAAATAGQGEILAGLFMILAGDLHRLPPGADDAAATAAYEGAYQQAAGLGARSVQLRAAVRLCKVASHGERQARLAALQEVFATFTEGLDTPDLRDAAEVLARA